MPPLTVGQSKVDPVTGITGIIYDTLFADPDDARMPDATVSGSILRKLQGGFFHAVAQAIFDTVASGVVGGTPYPWDVQSKSSDFAADSFVHYRVTTTLGDVTVTLPAAEQGLEILVKKISSDGNKVIFSGGTIDGDAALFFTAQWTALHLRAISGTTWDVI